MRGDVDTPHLEVRADLEHWSEWYVHLTGALGFPFDAVRLIDVEFVHHWRHAVTARTQRQPSAVGEYWSHDVESFRPFITITERRVTFCEAPPHFNFCVAITSGREYDLRTTSAESLMQSDPAMAVTWVDNHDSQPLQLLHSVGEPWCKPYAHAPIPRRRADHPWILHADDLEAEYTDAENDVDVRDIEFAPWRFLVGCFLLARKTHARRTHARRTHARTTHAWGEQQDYVDDSHGVGRTRAGHEAHPGGLALMMVLAAVR